jgi:predicted regulator of Ras-like GTPase activity (Roadblock/LC7/MglB family)
MDEKENLTQILQKFHEKIRGTTAVFLLDKGKNIIAFFPEESKEKLGFTPIICLGAIDDLNIKADDVEKTLSTTEMELFTENEKIYLKRIGKRFWLCVIGDLKDFISNFNYAKMLINDNIIKYIKKALEDDNLSID